MKKTIIIIFAVAAVLAGCKKERVSGDDGTGTLALSLTGNTADFIEVPVKAEEGGPTVDVNTFRIKIERKDGGYSREWESFSDMDPMLELSAGEYTVTASSVQSSGSKWGEAVYGGSKDFAIATGSVSNVDVVCSIANMKVTLKPTERFMAELSDVEVTVLSDVTNSITWTKSDIEADNSGYLSVAPLEVRVKGYRTLSGESASFFKKIDEVAAGSHYILNLDAVTTGELGGLQITIDDTLVDNEVNVDVPGFEEIPVDGGDEPSEPAEDPEPEEPAITMEWPVNPDFTPINIGEKAVDLKITVPAGIKTFVVNVSDNFKTAVSMITTGNVDYLDLINDETLISALSEMDPTMPLGDRLAGQTSVDFSLTSLISMITVVGTPGDDYVFTLSLSDNDDNTFTKSLTFIMPAA